VEIQITERWGGRSAEEIGTVMVINLNDASLSGKPINKLVTALIEQTAPSEDRRKYLGASSIGTDCLRKVQYNWMCDPVFSVRSKDIFARGHYFEGVIRQHLIAVGFKFATPDKLAFSALGGIFRGHADGMFTDGSGLPELKYPCLWENKCLNAKGFRSVEKDGLVGLYATYAAQVAVYQLYLDATNPALFSVINADTCEQLHFTISFNAQLAQTMIDRAVMVIEATRAGELLPRAYDSPDDWRCGMCQFKKRCWGQIL
jgi:hypothetical protein